MANDERVIIQHPSGDETHRVSVTRAGHKAMYPDWTVIGPETGASFVADVPRPAKRAGARRKTTKTAPKPARVVAPVTPPAEDA